MKIALFYPNPDLGCAWSLSHGLDLTLRHLGHEVMAVPVKTNYDPAVWASSLAPDSAVLSAHDLVFLSGPEHLHPFLDSAYRNSWIATTRRIPVVAWYHETFDRADVRPFQTVSHWATQHYLPSMDDAVLYKGTWMSFAADTRIFRPLEMQKEYDLGFIGVVYGKRQEYLDNQLGPALMERRLNLNLLHSLVRVGGVVDPIRTVNKYVEDINRIKVFLNLPSLSNLHVSKVVEVMACGVPLLTPKKEALFDNVFQYNPDDPREAARKASYLIRNNTFARRLAQHSLEEVQTHHSLEDRVRSILGGL